MAFICTLHCLESSESSFDCKSINSNRTYLYHYVFVIVRINVLYILIRIKVFTEIICAKFKSPIRGTSINVPGSTNHSGVVALCKNKRAESAYKMDWNELKTRPSSPSHPAQSLACPPPSLHIDYIRVMFIKRPSCVAALCVYP